MDKCRLQMIIEEALEQLIKNDRYLIEHDVHEQSISSKLGYYLSSSIQPRSNGGWDIDVEYNRNGEVPKSLCGIGNVRPDIIIHRRGLNNPNGYEENNLLIIQIKKEPTDENKKKRRYRNN